MQTFAIGVDLGGTNLRIAAVDESGKLLEKLTLGTEVKRGRDSVIQGTMCAAIEHVQAKYKDAGTLCGIGIGVPGFHRHGDRYGDALAQSRGLDEFSRTRSHREAARNPGHPGE